MLAALIIVIGACADRVQTLATAVRRASDMMIVDSCSDCPTLDDEDLHLEVRNCVRVPFVAVVPRRVKWLALLRVAEHAHRVARLEQPLIQRCGIQPSPSWHAAMLARHHQSLYGERASPRGERGCPVTAGSVQRLVRSPSVADQPGCNKDSKHGAG